MATTEELTLPGFRSDVHAFGFQFANLSPVPRELGLADFGLELIRPEINYSHVFPGGGIISMHRQVEDTVASIGRYSKRDGETWRRLAGNFVHAKDDIARWMNSPPTPLSDAIARLAMRPDGMDEYRAGLQSVRSWCEEHFEREETRLFIGAWACHVGLGPDDVGGGHMAWLFASLIQNQGNRAVKGGMHQLPLASLPRSLAMAAALCPRTASLLSICPREHHQTVRRECLPQTMVFASVAALPKRFQQAAGRIATLTSRFRIASASTT
jgi:phytoene dehydrogenase-like protein